MHKQRFRILLMVSCLMVAGFVMAIGWQSLSGATMAQVRPGGSTSANKERWEYCTILNITPGTAGWKAQVARNGTIETMESDLSATTTLNRLGLDGWELVSVSHLPGNSVEYFLKRPR